MYSIKWLRIIGPWRMLKNPLEPGAVPEAPPDAGPAQRGRTWNALTSEEFNRSTEKATTTPIPSSRAIRLTAVDLSMLNRPASQKTNGVSNAQVYICWNASAMGTVRDTTFNAGSR